MTLLNAGMWRFIAVSLLSLISWQDLVNSLLSWFGKEYQFEYLHWGEFDIRSAVFQIRPVLVFFYNDTRSNMATLVSHIQLGKLPIEVSHGIIEC